MAPPRHLVTPPSWLRLPRRTARLRLTLTCGGLFLLSGAALLTTTYLLVRDATPGTPRQRGPGSFSPDSGASSFPSPQGQLVLRARKAAAAVEYTSVLHQLLIPAGIGLSIVAVPALVLGWLVAGRILRPVRAITATARKISASNLHQRLPPARARQKV